MKGWLSQIVIGIIVTVIGTVIADSILRGSKGSKHYFGGHFTSSARSGR